MRNVTLSLRDRKAERSIEIAVTTNPKRPIRVLSALGCPVAERQGDFRRAITAAPFEDAGFTELGRKAIRKRNSKKELFEYVAHAVAAQGQIEIET